MTGGQMFVMNTNAGIAGGGRVLGTVNMLHREQFFTDEKLRLIGHLQVPAMAAFLADR